MKMILPLLAIVVLFGTGCGYTGSGSHTGYVTAVEATGMMAKKSTKVYVKTDLSSTQEDIYCVEDEDVIKDLKQAQQNKTNVILDYRSEYFVWPTRCNMSDTFITGVQKVEEVKK